MRTVIKNGRVVTAVDDYNADILIEDGRISVIAAAIDADVDKVIDAKGRLVIPGGIDPHTHMELPFGGTAASDTFETGTRAAAHGGTTTIIDFAVQYKGQSLREGLDNWHKKADGNTAIDYGFHLICTDLPDERLPEMKACIREGVSSFISSPVSETVSTCDVNGLFAAGSTTVLGTDCGAAYVKFTLRLPPTGHGLVKPISSAAPTT